MKIPDVDRAPLAWARLRFAIVGPLLAAPPGRGELKQALAKLSEQKWQHPLKDETVSFAMSTIERWYYIAKCAALDPLDALRRNVRADAGTHPTVSGKLQTALFAQYKQHPTWQYKLHANNLEALARGDSTLGAVPSHSTVRRYMKDAGLIKKRKPKSGRQSPGALRAAKRLEKREVRSYEMEHVHALWHCDFHVGSLDVITADGKWETPLLFAALDDCSRLCCHAQWFLGNEDTEKLVHGLCQAILKRGLPRALMSDNGCGMIAAETVEGLERLSVIQEFTLAESPYQNGKQETWWTQIEQRVLAMLEGEKHLTLTLLNEATQAWIEFEYHQKIHSELGVTPLERYLDAPDVGRPSPTLPKLRAAFRMTEQRSQRKSDGTVSIMGRRYEVPNHHRHRRRLGVRFARWDLSRVDMVDLKSDRVVGPLYPIDKHKNADGKRRSLEPSEESASAVPPHNAHAAGIAPLLQEMLDKLRSSGSPPAYLPISSSRHDDDDCDNDDSNNNKEPTES